MATSYGMFEYITLYSHLAGNRIRRKGMNGNKAFSVSPVFVLLKGRHDHDDSSLILSILRNPTQLSKLQAYDFNSPKV